MSGLFDRTHRRSFNAQTLFNMSDLSGKTQSHVLEVYRLLLLTVLSTFLSVYYYTSLASFATKAMINNNAIFPRIFSLLIVAYVIFTRPGRYVNQRENDPVLYGKRTLAMAVFGAFTGLSIAPLVDVINGIDENIVFTAIIATAVVFLSFSIAAFVAPRRHYFFLGGILLSGLNILVISSIVSRLFGGFDIASTDAALFIGLAIFSLYVIYDTQVMIDAFENGFVDPVSAAMDLFIDAVGTFVRIAAILARKKARDNEKKGRR